MFGELDREGYQDLLNRVYDENGIAPTMTASFSSNIFTRKKVRIRRLTETECLRLMGVNETDIKKIKSVVSATQAYKQAGNSIVVDVMVAIFENIFNEKTETGTQLTFDDII